MIVCRVLGASQRTITAEVLAFFADRLKVALREQGMRHDLIDAVFSLGNEDDLVRLVTRVEALQAFLKTDDGTNLLAGYKRAANILRIEEKKDGSHLRRRSPTGAPIAWPRRKDAVHGHGAPARDLIAAELERERFAEAMTRDGASARSGRCLLRQGDVERARAHVCAATTAESAELQLLATPARSTRSSAHGSRGFRRLVRSKASVSEAARDDRHSSAGRTSPQAHSTKLLIANMVSRWNTLL